MRFVILAAIAMSTSPQFVQTNSNVDIVSLEVRFANSEGRQLLNIEAKGIVGSGGWKSPRLESHITGAGGAPAKGPDGYINFDFKADPPGGFGTSALTTIVGKATIPTAYPKEPIKIRVYGVRGHFTRVF